MTPSETPEVCGSAIESIVVSVWFSVHQGSPPAIGGGSGVTVIVHQKIMRSAKHSDLADTLIFRTMTAPADSTNAPLSFSGHEYFRHRLVLSILSGRPVRIDKIRSADANPGLRGPSI